MTQELNSLGIAKAPADTRVVVAMSGGVDSSVVAAMLKDEGYDVVGVTLQLYDHGVALEKPGACCAGQDIYDARRVAESMDFPHYVLYYENRFKQDVIDDFAESYIRGETPVPCIRCNQTVKFRDLMATAKDLDADVLATGHYVQRNQDGDEAELHIAVDPAKDQSYFLFATTQEQLDMLRFPLGNRQKSETRELALKYGLAVADKPDSQDICFVPDGNYAKLVAKLRPDAARAGDIVDLDGKVMGRHEGTIKFTIGQRKGIGVGGTEVPMYVIRIDPAKNQVVIGPKAALEKHVVYLKELNWLPVAGTEEDEAVQVKLRSNMSAVDAKLKRLEGDRAEIWLDVPEYGIAPGQAAVIYNGQRVLGGGWIEGAELKPN